MHGKRVGSVRALFLCGCAASLLTASACERDSVSEEVPTAASAKVTVTPPPLTPVTPVGNPGSGPSRPTPVPTASDTPDSPSEPPWEDIPDNTNPVASVYAKVYWLECGGVPVPGSGGATTAPVGCRVHLDVTPSDASGEHTQAKNPIHWTFTGTPGSFSGGDPTDYTPTFTVLTPGSFSAFCDIDDVRSNTVNMTFQ